ncbi:GNAT family N-acetyltransferase [Streptomyces griseoviridis]
MASMEQHSFSQPPQSRQPPQSPQSPQPQRSPQPPQSPQSPPRALSVPSSPFPVLHGHGLRLRHWDHADEADVEAWLRGRTDPEFQRWNTPLKEMNDLVDARASLAEKALAAAERTAATYCVTDAATGATLGHISVEAINPVMRTGRIGYWVLPEARGRGVASRALAVVSRWALTELGLQRLELGHAIGHEASCRVAERCGYPYEGTLRGAMFEAGRVDRFRDMHLHGRTAQDPEPELKPYAEDGGGDGAGGGDGGPAQGA